MGGFLFAEALPQSLRNRKDAAAEEAGLFRDCCREHIALIRADPVKDSRAQLILDQADGLLQIGRAGFGIVAVGPQQLNLISPEHAQSHAGSFPVQEEAGIGLHQHGQFSQLFRNSVGAEGGNVPVNVGDDGDQVLLCADIFQLIVHLIRPWGLGHFNENVIRALYGKIGDCVGIPHPWIIIHLGTYGERRRGNIPLQCLPQIIFRLSPALQKFFRGIIPGIKMGRGDNMGNSLPGFLPKHGKGLLHTAAPIIDSGENMAVKINQSGHVALTLP